MSKLNLAVLTMDAGKGIEGSKLETLISIFKQNECFSKMFIVDGNLSDSAKQYYHNTSPNIVVIDSPWRDDYCRQYEAFASQIPDGEWCLYLDDDEIPSQELLHFLKTTPLSDDLNMMLLPCILHLTEDGKTFYAAEPAPAKDYFGQWVKRILFKKTETLYFRSFGSHVIPSHQNEKSEYIPHPYFHLKSLQSFVKNDVWQAFLHPEGQQFSALHAALFRRGVTLTGTPTTQQFKEKTRLGQWHPLLQKFAWDNRWEVKNPVSRLAWTYFLLFNHAYPEVDEKFSWDTVKNFILGADCMEIYAKSRLGGVAILT